jgi:hypothetical protein
MTEPGDASPMSLPERIEAIEQAYELMLAYAAQGRQNDTDDSSSIRRFLAEKNSGWLWRAPFRRARGLSASPLPS